MLTRQYWSDEGKVMEQIPALQASEVNILSAVIPPELASRRTVYEMMGSSVQPIEKDEGTYGNSNSYAFVTIQCWKTLIFIYCTYHITPFHQGVTKHTVDYSKVFRISRSYIQHKITSQCILRIINNVKGKGYLLTGTNNYYSPPPGLHS